MNIVPEIDHLPPDELFAEPLDPKIDPDDPVFDAGP